MFTRMIWRGLWQRKSRALVALLALTLASTLTAALLNLYVDAQRKIQSEFRRYGPNLMVTPRTGLADRPTSELLPGEMAERLERDFVPGRLAAVLPVLYAVVQVDDESVVVAGTWLDQFAELGGFRVVEGRPPAGRGDARHCWAGSAVAGKLSLTAGQNLTFRYRDTERTCTLGGVLETGQAEDSQILADLAVVQKMAGTAPQLNTILTRATGGPAEIERAVEEIQTLFPGAAVSPLRQVTTSEFRVVERIRRTLSGTTLVVLVITALCVLATMTTLAFERRRTIGTLKALGASTARISAFFLSEAVVLALLSGLAGFLAGMGLARWLGESLFAATVSVRWVTLPLVTLVALVIALVGTLIPLRLVRRTEPAVILRGE